MWNTEQDKTNYKQLLEDALEVGASEFQVQKALVNQDMGFFIGVFLQDNGVIDPGEQKLLGWIKEVIYGTPSFALLLRVADILKAVAAEVSEAEKEAA
ncbi:hypothetical protein GNF10_09590 [Nostoc sp. UCD121]|uniref:hypothetical protein n=1 Tax=unclassified Nostoc TaxID=2593658 RepID=UPI00162970BF|nr:MULTISPECIES: hypothetical protein [unclassified Nostoc]MBC1225189.1 hypothetical protein [Nostoc sp. UCD120]MBC1276237.1 hypothetical protein [Nostoc sp. UCD121]